MDIYNLIEIRVDGEPIGKGRPRFSRVTGRVYTPERTASYENRIAWAAQQVMSGKPLLTGPLKIHVEFSLQIPESKPVTWKRRAEAGTEYPTKRPDLDNMVKLIADSLNKVVWVDDSQVVTATMTKKWSYRPGVKILIDNLS